jgi:hypothetical protein
VWHPLLEGIGPEGEPFKLERAAAEDTTDQDAGEVVERLLGRLPSHCKRW